MTYNTGTKLNEDALVVMKNGQIAGVVDFSLDLRERLVNAEPNYGYAIIPQDIIKNGKVIVHEGYHIYSSANDLPQGKNFVKVGASYTNAKSDRQLKQIHEFCPCAERHNEHTE